LTGGSQTGTSETREHIAELLGNAMDIAVAPNKPLRAVDDLVFTGGLRAEDRDEASLGILT
jgi:hypothetical protein